MKKILTFILLIPLLIACRQQSKNDKSSLKLDLKDKKEFSQLSREEKVKDSILVDFSVKWKADCFGQNGFRMCHYSFDSSSKTWRINELKLKGYSKEKIIDLLGEPTNSGLGKEDKLLIMTYIVRQKKKTPEKKLILYFSKENNLDDIIEETGI